MILRAGDEANLVAFIPLSYIVPSYLLYLITLYVMFLSKSKSNYTGSFYKIFGVSAINSILNSLFYYFFTRAMACPAFLSFYDALPNKGFAVTLYYILLYDTQHSSCLFDLLLSFNRFTVIIFKAKYKSFWRNKLMFVIPFMFLLPNLITQHLWFADVQLKLYNESNPTRGYILDSQVDIPYMKNSRNTSIVVLTCAVLSLCMNLYVCGFLIRQRWQNKAGNASANNKTSTHNIKLFCFNLLVFSTQLASGTLQILFVVLPTSAQRLALFSYQVYVNDLVCLTPPWFLLALSSTLRREIARQLCCVDTDSTSVTVAPASSTINSSSNNRIKPSRSF